MLELTPFLHSRINWRRVRHLGAGAARMRPGNNGLPSKSVRISDHHQKKRAKRPFACCRVGRYLITEGVMNPVLDAPGRTGYCAIAIGCSMQAKQAHRSFRENHQNNSTGGKTMKIKKSRRTRHGKQALKRPGRTVETRLALSPEDESTTQELEAAYNNLKGNGHGGFADVFYWTSRHNSTSGAEAINFADGSFTSGPERDRSNLYYVRAIRSFISAP